MDSKHIWEKAKTSEPGRGFEGRVRERIAGHRRQIRRRRGLAGLGAMGLLAVGVGMWLRPMSDRHGPAIPTESAPVVVSSSEVGISSEDVMDDAAEFYFAEDTYLDDMIEAALSGNGTPPAEGEIQSYQQRRQFHELV
ncbi:hypothetical protein HY522_09985 [bacterium]|nr:hypothetical protein [bacterium]